MCYKFFTPPGCSFLYLMLNGECKASCPVGYYEDMEEGRCGQCHPTCGSCSGPSADDCETCSTYSPKLYKGVCSKDCPAGTYYEAAAMECQGEHLDSQIWFGFKHQICRVFLLRLHRSTARILASFHDATSSVQRP